MGWISNCLSCDQAGSHQFAIERQSPRPVEEVLDEGILHHAPGFLLAVVRCRLGRSSS